MPFETYLTVAGAVSASLLVAGLLAGMGAQNKDAWRIWPAPPAGSIKSFGFWTLFRTLNVAVLVLATERLVGLTTADSLTFTRLGLALVAIVAFAAYLYALWALGRKATYCQASGLTTDGIYRWSRNPQYATAILAFGALGLAAWSWEPTALAAALIAVYGLMAIAEEPWLQARYGRAYHVYRAEVPRFFNLRHARHELGALISRKAPPFANRREGK